MFPDRPQEAREHRYATVKRRDGEADADVDVLVGYSQEEADCAK